MENDTEPPTRWLIYSTIFLFCFFIFSSTSFAAEQSESEIISGWFKPSGPEHSNYEYKWYYRSWINECPACGSHNLAYNPKGVPEAEITCMHCSCDFDGVTGWEKQYNPRWRLTAAPEVNETKNETSQVQAAEEVNRHQWLVDEWNNWNKSQSLV